MSQADPILTYAARETAERHHFLLLNWLSLAGLAVLVLGALLAAADDLRSPAVRVALLTGAALFVAGIMVEAIRARKPELEETPPRIIAATAVVAGDEDEPCSVIIAESTDKTAIAFIERQLASRGVLTQRGDAMLTDHKGRLRLRGLRLSVRPRDGDVARAVAGEVLKRRTRVRLIIPPRPVFGEDREASVSNSFDSIGTDGGGDNGGDE